MSKNFTLKVNNSHKFSFSDEEIKDFDAIDFQNKYHVLHQDQSYFAELKSADFYQRSYTVEVNGNLYVVKIGTELDSLIENMGISAGATKVVNAIKAPMPGLILEIAVQEGQEVQENDALLILEAMKMENTISSPRSGIIKSIKVEEGNAVDKGQLLIEFE